jgi:hypothetical protein
MRSQLDEPLVSRGTRKALALTVALVAIASGLRFAWDQVSGIGLGSAIDGVRGAAQEAFSSEDILRSGEMITGALIREEYLPADGRGYTHRVSYTDRDSLARWTQSATFDALVTTSVDTRNIPLDAVRPRWEGGSKIVYEVRLPEPQLTEPFWVSQPRELAVDCNLVEAMWRFATVNPVACADDGTNADPMLRWKAEQDFAAMAASDEELFAMGRRDVEQRVEGIASSFIEPLADRYGFDYAFAFVWVPSDQ